MSKILYGLDELSMAMPYDGVCGSTISFYTMAALYDCMAVCGSGRTIACVAGKRVPSVRVLGRLVC